MSVKSSRAKGARFERILRDELRRLFRWNECRRSQQFCGATGEAADLTIPECPEISVECKAVSRESVRTWMAQAIRDAQLANKIPVLAHKVPQKDWLVTLRLNDLPEIVKVLSKHIPVEENESHLQTDST